MANVLNANALQKRFLDLGLPLTLPGQEKAPPTAGKHVTVLLDGAEGNPGRDAVSAAGGFAMDRARLAPARQGNLARFFVTGQDYFGAVADAISQAKEHVWIAGWQVGWDVELKEFGTGKCRLIDIIKAVDPKKIDIRFLIFGTTFDVPPIDDVHVAATLKSLGCKVLRAPGESDFDETIYSYFSHHQKCVIIDGKKAFLGGIDLTHGRRDDHTFPVVVDPHTRRINEMYNACVPHTRAINSEEQQFVKLATAPGGAREAYDNKAKAVLDHQRRPRQPWQDVHLQIEGPSVFDLVTNYVRRWNGLTNPPPMAYWNKDGSPPAMAGEQPIVKIGALTLDRYLPGQIAAAQSGGATVQILRSASADQNVREDSLAGLLPASMKTKSGATAKVAQVDIQEAMIRAIQGAQQFIYIENQYFISHYGAEQIVDANGVPMTSAPISDELRHANELFAKEQGWSNTNVFYRTQTHQSRQVSNLIVSALGKRIAQAIRQDKPFHVYLMMPLHSEGMLNSPMIMGVMHHTMQTLTFGSHSLINLVKRALLEKSLAKDGRSINDIPVLALNRELWRIPESDWSKYLTLLYARNFGQVPGGPLVTEQIYVHSKCMVVDDNVAIIGTANINDRSLMGDRDSEIAAMVVDTNTVTATLDGKKPAMVRKFARELRQALWKKHLGWSGPLPKGGVEKADLPATILDAPASLETARAIQRLAQANSEVYQTSFAWVPRNDDTRRSKDKAEDILGSSIWPGWKSRQDNVAQPWSDAFTGSSTPGPRISELAGKVKGFWCGYPYLWTQGQNNYDPRIALEFISQRNSPDTRQAKIDDQAPHHPLS